MGHPALVRGTRFKESVRGWGKKQQVPPLRYAPVGMTILLQGQVLLAEALAGTTELSSRPERSVVEGPAVSRRILTPSLGAKGCSAKEIAHYVGGAGQGSAECGDVFAAGLGHVGATTAGAAYLLR
jgi:hypothetical protein